MIRNRAPRFRNLQNLHVIPTASNFNSNPIPVQSESPNITIIPQPVTTTIDISNTNSGQKMFDQNKPISVFNQSRKNRNRRKRQRKCYPLTQAEIQNSSYNWYDSSYLNQTVYSDPPLEKTEDIDESLPEIPIEEDFEEVEVASEDGDGKQEILVGFRASKLQYLNYKRKCFFRPKFYKFGSQRTLVNCLNVQDNSSVDIDIVSEAEYEIDEADNLDQSDSQDQQISKINESNEHSESTQEEKPIEKSKVIEMNDVNDSSKRIFKTCIEENADINQGQCLIQSSLDTWKSHLIGLEYLIEIRDKNNAKYYCVLCSEHLLVEKIPSISVINHINGCKHVIAYLEKHFPSYGFKFDENNVDTLRKVCEEINEKMGYFSICITNFDYFDKNEQKIKNIILNASHVNEEGMKLETCVYQKEKDSDTLKDVQYVIEDVIEKVLIFIENNTMDSKDVLVEDLSVEVGNETSHTASSELQSDSIKKSNKKYKSKESMPKNNLKSPKSFLKYKGNSNLSSYLKVKYAKAKSKGLVPLKGLSNRNRRLSAEKGEKKSSIKEIHVDETSSPTKPEEVISECIHSDTSKKVLGDEEKVLQKPTVHSKHCRKRILGRESTRLKETAKESIKEKSLSSTAKRSKEKCVPILELENKSSSKKIDQSLKLVDTIARPSSNSSPAQKVAPAPIQKVCKQDSKSSVTKHSKSAHKDICKKSIENSKLEKEMMVKNSPSNWKAMTRSPVKSSDNSHISKSETTKHSRSPPIKRTVRRISKSPLRLVRRSPVRKFSRSPVRKHSRSPMRRKSRSPLWKHSRSPFRKKSRSPIRKQSRSPLRRHSRSPVRRYNRGSFRRQSRSPVRRRSRSPLRRRSRSPLKRRSRSPLKRRSRSPLRRRSRSPRRRISRSPLRRHSRSPVRRRSRSPNRKHSRSPIKRLRSPIRKQSRGSVSVSQSPPKGFRSIFKVMSSNSNQDHIISDKRSSQNVYKNLGKHDRDFIEVRSSKNYFSPSNSAPDKHKSHTFASSAMRGTSDLDPVSDEDESIYFDKQRIDDCITPSSKKMFAQFLQKFSVSNVNPDDPSLNKLMLFMEAHEAEIEELMGSQTTSKAGKTNVNAVDPNLQERNLFLQQYLLSNLAGGDQEPGLSSLNLNKKTKYQQPPFLSETDNVGCGIVHNVAPHNHPQSNLPAFFPPNVNVPPPDPYRPFNQPHQEFSPRPQVPQEVMFKDLKATVSKLFGANESATKLDKNKSRVPEYVTEPDPEKWDLSHPDTHKFNAPPKFSGHTGPRFNAPINQKNVFHPQGNSENFSSTPESSVMRADLPGTYNNNSPGQFFSARGIDRSQGLNVSVPPPDAKVSFCDVPRSSSKGNLFPVVHNVNSSFGSSSTHGGSISDVKVSLAQRLASVLVKIGMTDVPAPLLQEMLMKIGAFSSLPRQDISEAEIISILKRLGYLF